MQWQAPDAKANVAALHKAEPSAGGAHAPNEANVRDQLRSQRPRRAKGPANM